MRWNSERLSAGVAVGGRVARRAVLDQQIAIERLGRRLAFPNFFTAQLRTRAQEHPAPMKFVLVLVVVLVLEQKPRTTTRTRTTTNHFHRLWRRKAA
jgi:hypothetical protein